MLKEDERSLPSFAPLPLNGLKDSPPLVFVSSGAGELPGA
jgi:hypothetical protein